jgi:hypothetical protein
MNKIAQQTRDQAALVGESQPPDEHGQHAMGNPTDLSPGGSDTPQKDSGALTHGQESYPGLRPGDANNSPGSSPPAAGDVDKEDTDSANATGQNGDLTDINKKKAYNYS